MAKWTVVCDSVEHWAATYTGPKFHAMLTDSPYELNFMSKSWDRRGISFNPATWAALAEHLLPGAHILAFGGDRTHHRLMYAIEDAGLELRTCLYWAFGSGFPKSLNVGKAIDKAVGAEREVVGQKIRLGDTKAYPHNQKNDNGFGKKGGRIWRDPETAPATPAAATWEGYGTALKPAVEVIVMARKPLEGTVAGNCQRYGSGALAIDACRVAANGSDPNKRTNSSRRTDPSGVSGDWGFKPILDKGKGSECFAAGRWPANLILDDSEAVAGLFPSTGSIVNTYIRSTNSGSLNGSVPNVWSKGIGKPAGSVSIGYGDSGSAARFFFAADWSLDQAEQLDAADVLRYAAKASRAERDAGLDEFEAKVTTEQDKWAVNDRRNGTARQPTEWKQGGVRNNHPTVKPLSLCRYLATLLLPPAAYAPRRILVPFAGVGSEMIGAGLVGWDEIVGIEQELEYTQIAEARLAYWLRQPELALR